MNIVIGTVLLWGLAYLLWHKLPDHLARRQSISDAVELAKFTLPRITLALIGAALFAELLAADQIESLFGADAGMKGIVLAFLIAPIVPGGVFVAFAIGAAGLKVGASEAAVMTYVTSWGLFSVTKALVYEIPLLGGRIVLYRFLISLPMPFLVALAALAIG